MLVCLLLIVRVFFIDSSTNLFLVDRFASNSRIDIVASTTSENFPGPARSAVRLPLACRPVAADRMSELAQEELLSNMGQSSRPKPIQEPQWLHAMKSGFFRTPQFCAIPR